MISKPFTVQNGSVVGKTRVIVLFICCIFVYRYLRAPSIEASGKYVTRNGLIIFKSSFVL